MANPDASSNRSTGLSMTGQEMQGAAHSGKLSLRQKYRYWRNQKIADPAFRRKVGNSIFTRWFANKQANDLFKITAGFVYSQILHACVELDLFKTLQSGPKSAETLARICDLKQDRLLRLLEAAENLKLVICDKSGLWWLDDFGAVIAGDPGISAMVRHHTMLYQDLSDPVALLRSEKADTRTKAYWSYATTQNPENLSPEASSPYSDLMRQSQAMFADVVLEAYPFQIHKKILDIGGGDGTFLAHLDRRHPGLDLNLFDLPAVIDHSIGHLNKNGAQAKVTTFCGTFFEDDLPSGMDCITLVRIICDHDDHAVLRLLKNIHLAMKPDTRLVIAEAMNGSTEGERLASAYFKLYFSAMGSGQCRTPAQIQGLLKQAGFSAAKVTPTSNPLIAGIIVANK